MHPMVSGFLDELEKEAGLRKQLMHGVLAAGSLLGVDKAWEAASQPTEKAIRNSNSALANYYDSRRESALERGAFREAKMDKREHDMKLHAEGYRFHAGEADRWLRESIRLRQPMRENALERLKGFIAKVSPLSKK